MVKSESLSDRERLEILSEELEKFENLIRGHRKLLKAIGEL
ncbi:MAG TPA: hypothetical protein VJI46_03970 [Candidatus Nanoarchaeia archaeon]|nr:hypothetical protein [Candidatus Nanoarchaeia archaeon]